MQNHDKDPQGSGGGNGGNAWMKNMLVVFAIVGALFLFVSLFNGGMGDSRQSTTIPYSEFLSKVDDGSVKEVTIADNVITGKYAGDQTFRTISPNDNELVDRLQKKSIKFSVKPEEQTSIWM